MENEPGGVRERLEESNPVMGVSFLVGFYCVFVIQQLWNWFAAPLLHFGEVSYLQMYGLNILSA